MASYLQSRIRVTGSKSDAHKKPRRSMPIGSLGGGNHRYAFTDTANGEFGRELQKSPGGVMGYSPGLDLAKTKKERKKGDVKQYIGIVKYPIDI